MKRLPAVATIVIALIIGAGIAYASIPGPDGVIHGCYKTSNPAQGALIVIDSAASCPSGYTALNWNQTGPQGPAGISGYEVVHDVFVANNGTETTHVTNCPVGKTAFGGGYDPTVHTTLVQITADAPFIQGIITTGWYVTVQNNFGNNMNVHAWAICAVAS